ncbi:MarR family winged helix-turn-helix transcriptional regulator [Microbacterium sp. ARD31]|uniref:MarR family winged helix-turn-helix transcriptional regulator n=1 Tax=Microbacterium sp. ARD31 TaxID=2962576 RepID=UPI002881D551|nr:MarR family winged helix-turn-helix transcriptional regulator [Microbacterium sp. ARD31]MDT0184828.1 MarR family winged helix-turn-helix transcriptional regulator [Microbacterium sp. ARD31]
MADAPNDPADAIADALARLRSKRGPRPPGVGPQPLHGPHPHSADEHRGRGHHEHHHGRGGGPWAGGARLGGPARLRMLEALAAASGGLSISAIADAVGVDQPRASRLVQQSVELGLVVREADPDDARRTLVALTDQGRSAVRGFRGERRSSVAAALESFTDAERAELARLLAKLADGWPV